MPEVQEIIAEFRTEIWSSLTEPRFLIACCEIHDNGSYRDLTIKGNADELELQPGITYRFMGRYEESPKFGKQFAFQSFVQVEPHGRRGIVAYLRSLPGIGMLTAKRLYDQFGSEAVATLRERPEEAAASVDRLGPDKALEACKALQLNAKTEGAKIDMLELLDGRGFPKTLPKTLMRQFGNRAPELIRKNPYLLMRFGGIGFLRADRLYLDLGLDPAKLKRQALCMQYALTSDTEGHTWHSVRKVEEAVRSWISSAKVQPAKALRLAVRAKLIETKRDDGESLWVADRRKAVDEDWISRRVQEIHRNPEKIAWPASISNLSAHQADILGSLFRSRVAILGGGPGTGKTFSTAQIVKAMQADGLRVAVCGPTGKSAVRITDAMRSAGLEIEATTIHRLLGCQPGDTGGHDGTGWKFVYNAGNFLPLNVVVVDESSMISSDLMADLLQSCGVHTHLLLVGDIDQLPPVGHGAPLRDLIAAGLPYGELTEIRRNAGQIVKTCHSMKNENGFAYSGGIHLDIGENLYLSQCTTPAAQIQSLERFFAWVDYKGFDPVNDVQVLTPVNDKSEVSRTALNTRLQPLLNPDGDRCKSNPFLAGDKVICTKNGWYNEPGCQDQDERFFVANGEIGIVDQVFPKRSIVKLDNPSRIAIVPQGAGQTGSWQLAYAVTVHKSQGSEWPVVAFIADESSRAKWISSRESVYTAISRAKKLCVVFGKDSTIEDFCRQQVVPKRKTFLKELLR